MNYTPLAHLTDDEFIIHLSMMEEPTDEAVEAMIRLERATELNGDLIELCKEAGVELP